MRSHPCLRGSDKGLATLCIQLHPVLFFKGRYESLSSQRLFAIVRYSSHLLAMYSDVTIFAPVYSGRQGHRKGYFKGVREM